MSSERVKNLVNKVLETLTNAKLRMFLFTLSAMGVFSAATSKPVAADWAGNGSISSPADIPPALTSMGGWVVASSRDLLTQWPYSLITVIIVFVVVIAIGIMLLMKIKGAAGKK